LNTIDFIRKIADLEKSLRVKIEYFLKRLFALRKKENEVTFSREFFTSQSSCQIPNLGMLYSKFLGEREFGTFVEIGANDGISCSNTWGLAERGWTGFMVEPIPKSALACKENHRNHPRVNTYQYAIGNLDGINLKLTLAGMLTTANPDLHAEYLLTEWATPFVTSEEVVIQSKKLDTFLVEIGIEKGFDVLVVDVEGFESQVFAGFSLSLWCPKMLIVELADTHPDLNSTSKVDARLGKVIVGTGYSIVYKDCINTVFIRDDVWEYTFRSD
jgi:FkbM family methyltransferase